MAVNVFKINGNGVRIPVLSSDPGSPENGMLWYNSTDNVFRKYENGAISDLGSGDVASEDVSYDNTSSGLAATTAQDAIDELDGRIDGLEALDPMEYKGTWGAATNTPTLADGVGGTGDVYRVSTAGTQNLGSGNITFAVGDKIVYNGATWEKWDMTDAVESVNGQTGTVVLDTDDISEGSSNLYFNETRVLSTVLTGLDSEGSTITATDSVLGAFEKLDEALDTKMSSVSDDTAPSLGGDLTVGDNVLVSANGIRQGTSDTDWFVEQYIHSSTLTGAASNTALTALGFAAASYESVIVDYKIKEATTNRVRTGQLYIATNGTDATITDTFTETGDVGVVWDLNIDDGAVQVRYTTTANNKTMRCTVKRIKA